MPASVTLYVTVTAYSCHFPDEHWLDGISLTSKTLANEMTKGLGIHHSVLDGVEHLKCESSTMDEVLERSVWF